MVEIFDYLSNELKLPTDQIANFPELFKAKTRRIKERSGYLKKLQRDQYDPKCPGYVPPLALALGDDVEFVERYVRSSIDDYNLYLKTL